jgi:hypothetical protein
MSVCKIKNLTGDITPLYEHEFQIDEIFEITSDKREAWATNDDVLIAISNENFEIHNEDGAINGISNQIDWLKGSNPIVVSGTDLVVTP